ncbi:hypothetical protein [Pedosphaera parvula]|nr:hypothetical protein [Pedosphaera parvula]
MRKSIKAINRAIRRLTATELCPTIRWDDILRIEALGTDAFGAFEISLTFIYADNSEVSIFVHHKGYDKILESLAERFPSIPSTWHDEMAQQPWHVERVLYERD